MRSGNGDRDHPLPAEARSAEAANAAADRQPHRHAGAAEAADGPNDPYRDQTPDQVNDNRERPKPTPTRCGASWRVGLLAMNNSEVTMAMDPAEVTKAAELIAHIDAKIRSKLLKRTHRARLDQ
jgi:hypothetical protein